MVFFFFLELNTSVRLFHDFYMKMVIINNLDEKLMVWLIWLSMYHKCVSSSCVLLYYANKLFFLHLEIVFTRRFKLVYVLIQYSVHWWTIDQTIRDIALVRILKHPTQFSGTKFSACTYIVLIETSTIHLNYRLL